MPRNKITKNITNSNGRTATTMDDRNNELTVKKTYGLLFVKIAQFDFYRATPC